MEGKVKKKEEQRGGESEREGHAVRGLTYPLEKARTRPAI